MHHLFLVEEVIAATFSPVVHSQVLNNSFYDLVVLLFGGTEIWPCQILQLRYNATAHDRTISILLGELKPPLDEIWHQ